MNDLSSIVGADYTITPLKPWIKRFRNARRAKAKKQPSVYLVTGADGKRYKWLQCFPENQFRIDAFRKRYDKLGELDCVPGLVWSDETNLLFEFVEGEVPSFQSETFARLLGAELAKVHHIGPGTMPVQQLKDEVTDRLEFLEEHALVREPQLLKALSVFDEKTTDHMLTGMVYADFKPINFALTEAGKLYFIDLGGFAEDRLIGSCFFGNPRSYAIPREVFRESYEEHGGPVAVFDDERVLAVAYAVAMAERNFKLYEAMNWSSPILKKGRLELTRRFLRRLSLITEIG